MKKNKIVLFDIDYVLFHVPYFDENFYNGISDILNEDPDMLKAVGKEIAEDDIKNNRPYNVERFISTLLGKLGKTEFISEINSFLYHTNFFRNGFYKEVENVLKSLEDIARLGIFSQGDIKFQKAKIDQSGFRNYFDEGITYFVNPRKLEILPLLKERYENQKLYLVDDKPDVIHEFKKSIPGCFTIWIKRGKFLDRAEGIKGFKPDATIDNLAEVVEIIKDN